ncbi:MAG TPA: RodZ domain-containing protein [Patescibacteria group bacterium]|nr:RodZ domain-containing protein [Patescibacteria group bacterium]
MTKFERKKIQLETLGEYLKAVRDKLGLDKDEVIKKTGIGLKFLTALEAGELKTLPADVYTYGFLRQLAGLYAIDAAALIDQYKKERNIAEQLAKNRDKFGRSWLKRYFPRLVITPKILSLTLGLAFVAISVGYIIWQVWSINDTPALQIQQPQNNAVIQGSYLQIQGKTDPGISILINEQPIFVDGNGGFQAQLGLSPGPRELTITARNRFGKTLTKTLQITGVAPAPAGSPAQVQLKLDFTDAVALTAALDDQPAQTFNFNAGDSKTFTAQQQILLSTSNAGATQVTLNGQTLGPLGRAKEALANIPFFAQSGNINNGKP